MKFIFSILVVCCGVSKALAEETFGLVMITKGHVQILKMKEAPMPTKIGEKIYPLDTIITGKDSVAKIVMSDRNIVNILPDTRVRIDQYISEVRDKNVRLSLIQGKIRTNVEQKYDGVRNHFEIKTPNAIVNVRGTQFITSYNKALHSTEVITLRGEVAFQGLDVVSNKLTDTIIVQKNEVSQNFDGHIPSTPTKMSPADARKIEIATALHKNESDVALEQVIVPKNIIDDITSMTDHDDNLLSDTTKNIINKPAKVTITIQQ